MSIKQENINIFSLLQNDVPEEVPNDRTQINKPNEILKRVFPICNTDNNTSDWSQIKPFAKRKGYRNERHLMNINTNQEVKKKTFMIQAPKSQGVINLPSYYKYRSGNNAFEIPQCEYDWVKRVGGLEKSDSIEHMFRGIINCAISYFDNKNYMMKNKFFSQRISVDPLKQEENIELLCIQTTAILFHRLIKSDSLEIIKTIFKNIPIFRAVPGNPFDISTLNRSDGANAYIRMKHKFINDLRIIQRKIGQDINDLKIVAANKRIKDTEQRWMNYILQSVWNGNNPIHDCLYYGACGSMAYLLSFYFEKGMQEQLNTMLLVPNIQNETHADIIINGKKSCENQSTYIIRRKQFEECELLYNRTTETLRKYMNKIVDDEAEMIIPRNNYDVTIKPTQIIENSGDDNNICSLITSGNVEGMIAHIRRCAEENNNNIIKKTLELWQSAVSSDETGQYGDYLDDVKYQMKDIISKLYTLEDLK